MGKYRVGSGGKEEVSGASVNIATMVVFAAPIIVFMVAIVKGIRFRRQSEKNEEIMV